MKKIFLHGLIAGIISALAGIIYFKLYQAALGTSFDKIINTGAITASSITGCMLMAVGYFLLIKIKKENFKGALNIIIAVLSFASIPGPVSMSLPTNINSPELFPGLVAPMHFLPALIFFAIDPFFKGKATQLNVTG